jgi:small-conductance mechanosensitive channel
VALGSDQSSLKGDADEGMVELTMGNNTYTRTHTRQNETVTVGGEPYLDDPELADLFAFLLESNEARRAVARGDDLRDLIMRPVDTDAIQAEIEQLETEKRQLDDDLAELDSLKQQLPGLEEEPTRLETEIEEKQAELATKEAELEDTDADIGETKSEKAELEEKLDELSDTRSRLEDVRFKISTEEESIEALEDEATELEAEDGDLIVPCNYPNSLQDTWQPLTNRIFGLWRCSLGAIRRTKSHIHRCKAIECIVRDTSIIAYNLNLSSLFVGKFSRWCQQLISTIGQNLQITFLTNHDLVM